MKVKNMTHILNPDLLKAMQFTRAGRLTEATAALQRILGGSHPAPNTTPAATTSAARFAPPTLDGVAEPCKTAKVRSTTQGRPSGWGVGARQLPPGPAARGRPALPEALQSVLAQISQGGAFLRDGPGSPSPTTPQVPLPDGAQFLAATLSNQAGSRPYKLYVPSGYRPGQPLPLVVMLHGCTQSPDDFAAGTRMNLAAEAHTCLVVYPGQTASANMQRCWNWFSEDDQHRDRGEPALIAGITREVMRDYTVDPRRVYVAGLSAGGAAAAIMGDAYPDLYAAIGVHSGLACGAANNMRSAFAAMQGGAPPTVSAARAGVQRPIVPLIVFHGDRDTTVNLRNAEAIVTQSAGAATLRQHADTGHVPGAHAFTRTLYATPDDRTVIEQWVVHGAGHAWFGGSPAGSYTDPRGPDATREMLRFFLEHPRTAPIS